MKNIIIDGAVNASAEDGEAGTFLIDPTDINIVSVITNPAIGDDGDGTFTCNANVNDILDTTIEGYLNGGTNVVLDTSDYDAFGPYLGTGDITIWAPIDNLTLNNGTVSLTLYAANDIIVNAPIDASGASNSLNIVLRANQVSANPGDDGNLSAGDVDINASIITNGGNFSSYGVNFDNTGGTISTGGGTVYIHHTGNVTIGSSISAGAGNITIDPTNIYVNSNLTNTGNITLSATGNIDINAIVQTTGTNSTVTITADNDTDGAGDLTIAGTAAASVWAVNGDITLEGENIIIGNNVFTGYAYTSGTGNIDINADRDAGNDSDVTIVTGSLNVIVLISIAPVPSLLPIVMEENPSCK